MIVLSEQTSLLLILGGLVVALISGKWRYDAVALIALALLVLLGIVPLESAFIGFSHPAVIIVALVLLISRGLQESGFVSLIGNSMLKMKLSENQFLLALLFIGMLLSSFMNNIGAMAVLLPITLATCQTMSWNPSKFLMPLAFACILGGMNTMIGTPPNIIISQYREDIAGSSFNFFDYSYVGLSVSIAGILFIGMFGYRFLKYNKTATETTKLIDLKNYLFEVMVKEDSPAIGKRLSEITNIADSETVILGLVNENGAIAKVGMSTKIRAGQILVIKTDPNEIASIKSKLGLEIADNLNPIKEEDIEEIEAMITPASRLIGRNHTFFKNIVSTNLALLGLWRQGAKFRTRLARENFKVGDVLLLGLRDIEQEEIKSLIKHLGLMPIMSRDLQVIPSRSRLLKSIILFLLCIGLAAFNVINIVISFLICVLGFVRFKVLNGNLYRNIEWPIIILLAAMVPIGQALQSTGITQLIAAELAVYTGSLSLPWILLIVLVFTMLVSDILNNAATAIIMAPIAVELAIQLQAPLDAFLMAVAIGASCAFLSPIGHQCNTLVMAPGKYKFSDYWRIGLPLELIIAIISIPMIMFIWG